MKHPIESHLIAAQPPSRGNKAFVARTMQAVKRAKSGETFSRALRTTHVAKKERLFMKLKHLPTAVIVMLVVGAILLITGTAYAAYKLWLSPEAHVTSVEQKHGRDQALIDLKNCGHSDEKVQVEISKDGPGNPEEAAKSLVAQCELQVIQSWAMSELGVEPSNILFAYTIKAINFPQVSVSSKYQDTRTLTLSKDTPIIFNGNTIKQDDLHEGDAVAFVVSGPNQELRALVKLSQPIQYYDYSTDVQSTYYTRHECYGNPGTSCIDTPSLDVLREGEGGANGDAPGEGKLFQGKVVSFTDALLKLQPTSGEIYTIYTGKKEVTAFNATNPYGLVAIEKDDVLEVRYSQLATDNPLEIQSHQYHAIQLLLKEVNKQSKGNFQKYHY